jgi:hypothetical protein
MDLTDLILFHPLLGAGADRVRSAAAAAVLSATPAGRDQLGRTTATIFLNLLATMVHADLRATGDTFLGTNRASTPPVPMATPLTWPTEQRIAT